MNTDTHKYKVTRLALVSLRWEGVKEVRPRTSVHLYRYLHPTHYRSNMTFTLSIIIKDLSWRKNIIILWECLSYICLFFVLFCNRVFIVVVSALVLDIGRNVLCFWLDANVEWVDLCFWLVVLGLLLSREEHHEENPTQHLLKRDRSRGSSTSTDHTMTKR